MGKQKAPVMVSNQNTSQNFSRQKAQSIQSKPNIVAGNTSFQNNLPPPGPGVENMANISQMAAPPPGL